MIPSSFLLNVKDKRQFESPYHLRSTFLQIICPTSYLCPSIHRSTLQPQKPTYKYHLTVDLPFKNPPHLASTPLSQPPLPPPEFWTGPSSAPTHGNLHIQKHSDSISQRRYKYIYIMSWYLQKHIQKRKKPLQLSYDSFFTPLWFSFLFFSLYPIWRVWRGIKKGRKEGGS